MFLSLYMLCLIANISSSLTRKLPSKKRNTGSFVQESKFDHHQFNQFYNGFVWWKTQKWQAVNGTKRLIENPGFAALDTTIWRKSFKPLWESLELVVLRPTATLFPSVNGKIRLKCNQTINLGNWIKYQMFLKWNIEKWPLLIPNRCMQLALCLLTKYVNWISS